jgi:HD-GYP domain-containing protein (c-di-GMP phosphodiesterase class II)
MTIWSEKTLLAGERDDVLDHALQALSTAEHSLMANKGIDCHRVLAMLFDYALEQDEKEISSAGKGLSELAVSLSQCGLDWSAASVFVKALISGVQDRLKCGDDCFGLNGISSGMLKAQALIFDSYMKAEERKREVMAQQLREIDAFPDTIAATLDPPTLTKIGLARLKKLLGIPYAAMFEVDASRFLTLVGGEKALHGDDGSCMRLDEAAAHHLLHKGEPHRWVPGEEDSFLGEQTRRIEAAASLLIPMLVRGRTTGLIMIAAGKERGDFTAGDAELASRFARRMAVALENAYLHEREQRKIKETVALLEITRAINSTLDISQILEQVVQMTVDLCGVVMCIIYLHDEEAERFEPSAHYGFIEESHWSGGTEAGFTVDGLQDLEVETLMRGDPVFLPASQAACLLPGEVMNEHGVGLVSMFPLSSKERLRGLFALFYPCKYAVGLKRDEVEVVRAIAAQASMAIENAALYEDIEKSYFSTVKALAKAIEVKDPYTHGHSERVTEYAMMIADTMCLEERDKQKLKYAATLHDIGKIGIAGRVLNKPGSLTNEEYSHVKTHPALGDSIVEPVEFLQGPRPIILHHHERFDGKGYPDGLKGNGIPLCARILSVADAFEAMRSDRPYRRALPLEKAIDELKRNSGGQFDPEIVSIFMEILDRHGGDPVIR